MERFCFKLKQIAWSDPNSNTLGDEWFAKGVERGANREGVDHELRSIFVRAGKAQQDELKRHLLRIDPVRYGWVNKTKGGKKRDGGVKSTIDP